MNTFSYIPYVYEKFMLFMMVMTRVTALFSTFVLFKRDLVSPRILISLSSILSIYVLMFYLDTHVQLNILSINMFLQLIFQTFIGFIIGLMLNLIFEIFSAMGQFISMQIGLNAASLFDPRFGHITTLTNFYMYSIMLIFLSLDGHIFAMKTILDSFALIPLGQAFIPKQILTNILAHTSIIYSDGVALSITITVAVMVTNFSVAMMTRFAPQFNVFSVGITMTLIIGLGCLYLTTDLFFAKAIVIMQDGMEYIKLTLAKMSRYGH